MQERLTVFIGRFSPFHLGHEEVLKRALLSSKVVLLLIGSAGTARNIKNPFTYKERLAIVKQWYDTQCRLTPTKLGILEVAPLYDHPYNNQEWIAEVQEIVLDIRSKYNIDAEWPNFLTGAQRDASTWYLEAFGSFFKQDFISESKIGFEFSATQLRDNYFNGGNAWEYKVPPEAIAFLDSYRSTEYFKNMVDEYSFVAKYKEAWKNAPYAPIFSTVDACVIQSGHILVVTRAAQPGKGLLALPGGFVEQKETLVDAAVRELLEETSIGLSKAQLYGSIVDKEIFDHPERSLRGRTITTCFTFKLKDIFELPKIKPQKGEATKVQWMPIAEAKYHTDKWFEDHHAIFTTMLGRIKS